MKIAVDFDGVIHKYSKGWHDGSIYDAPMDGCYDAMCNLRDRGHEIVIYSSRVLARGAKRGALDAMRSWLRVHKIPYDSIATEGKPAAHVYLDDRALRFTGDWEKTFWELLELADNEPTTLL